MTFGIKHNVHLICGSRLLQKSLPYMFAEISAKLPLVIRLYVCVRDKGEDPVEHEDRDLLLTLEERN